MVKTSVWAAVLAGCLFASQAYAQADGGSYSQLSTGNKKIVDAMFLNQTVPLDGTPLSPDQIADLKAGSGWGNAFKTMQAAGRLDGFKNLGDVISTQNRIAREARKAGTTTEESALSENGSPRQGNASKDFKRVEKVERTAKIDRPQKLDRPDKPDRPARAERPQRPDRPERR